MSLFSERSELFSLFPERSDDGKSLHLQGDGELRHKLYTNLHNGGRPVPLRETHVLRLRVYLEAAT